MERLTNKREADAQREEYERRLANGYPRNIPEERFLRLAAYEDTGLTPEQCENAKVIIESAFSDDTSKAERIRELLKADKDGRVVILPCAPDAIYWEKVGGILAQSRFEGLHVYEDGTIKYAGYGMEICAEDIGKTVFLSREEAEKALQEMEGKKDD